jgi:hypothetical protein
MQDPSSSFHAAVTREVTGIHGAGVAQSSGDTAVDREGLLELSGDELRQVEVANAKVKRELDIKDKKEIDALYDPGSWRCTRCKNVLLPTVIECPNYLKVEIKGSKFGSGMHRLCKGSQRETWGGYVRGADLKPQLTMREHDPNWRGKFSGGARAQRQRAKEGLTEEEILEGFGVDDARTAVIQSTLKARGQVRDARHRQKEKRVERMHDALREDQATWPCPRSVTRRKERERTRGIVG